jgi:hypothetical protein
MKHIDSHIRYRAMPRPKLAPRSLEEVYRLPPQALLTPAEAGLVTRLTESALAVRRSKGQWPPYAKFGRLVRYVMEDVLTPPRSGEV